MQLKDLKKGELFRLVTKKGVGTKVYVRDEYCRAERKYYAVDYMDICNCRLLKPTQEVVVDFEF